MPGARHPLVLLLAALVAGSCGGDDGAAPPLTQTPQPAPPAGECQPATSALMNPLTKKLKSRGAFLENGQVVKSRDHDELYFVSAEIEGPGFVGSGQIATWATMSLDGGEAIYSVDELAKSASSWEDGTKADLSLEDHGAQESRRCVSA